MYPWWNNEYFFLTDPDYVVKQLDMQFIHDSVFVSVYIKVSLNKNLPRKMIDQCVL